MLFASNSLESLRVIALEGIELFSSRGFRVQKWVANFHAKEILRSVPHCDLATQILVRLIWVPRILYQIQKRLV